MNLGLASYIMYMLTMFIDICSCSYSYLPKKSKKSSSTLY